MAEDPIIIGQVYNMGSGVERHESSTGRVRYAIRMESEPLIHEFDPKTLGAPIAAAIAETLKRMVKDIAAAAKPATLEYRKRAERAFNGTSTRYQEAKENRATRFGRKEIREGRGHLLGPTGAWAQKRYAGGRMGPMAPNQSNRAFNDSGRFAESITANGSEDGWRINVAANRLDETTTGGMIGVRRIWNKLVEHVPAFGNPALLFNEKEVQDGLVQSLEAMIVKAEKTRDELTRARAMAALQRVRQVFQALLQMAA